MGVKTDPIAVDLNVDAALLLKDMVGIDSYPTVLALMPNVFSIEDRDRVHAVVTRQLAEAGLIVGDCVHPAVEDWLWCLYRPDMELAARVLSTDDAGKPAAMLRLSLVRRRDTHVLAVRCDDEIVVQPVFHEGRHLDTVAAVVVAALGTCPALYFEPMTATMEHFGEVPSDPDERRRALVELGAKPHTAAVLTRALNEIACRAEILMIEHRDGGPVETDVCVSVLDSAQGRIVVTPSVAMDGEVRSTYAPGDDEAVQAGLAALIELLPSRSWFNASRDR